jgi:superfamily II DNA or RNA helicase
MSFRYDCAWQLAPRDYQKDLISAAKRSFREGGRDLVQVATGGGKTLVISDIAHWAAATGKKVLVVTKDWELLGQIGQDLCRRHQHGAELCGYVGETADARRIFGELGRPCIRNITFTTIQSWHRKSDGWPAPDMILIDELHWGEGAPLYSKLLEKFQSAYVIGFTATPRNWSTFRRIGRRIYDFAHLVEKGVLSRPVIEPPVLTGTNWAPRRTGSHGDITQESLSTLAVNVERNKCIVSTYVRKKSQYGKTLVFACNISHANALVALFNSSGVTAKAVHCLLSSIDKSCIIGDFREGVIDVLVNVTMLTHGVDIPDIQTIFLTRPTLSDILFSQMIGRGARRTRTKDKFYVVDFVDASGSYGLPIIRPDGFFGTPRTTRGPEISDHSEIGVAFEQYPNIAEYSEICGLDINSHQTFGIEFEVATSGRLADRGAQILSALRDIVPTAQDMASRGRPDYRVWNVVYDSTCGLEVVSRILRGQEGFSEVMDVTRKLQEMTELRVNRSTGTHVHLGWNNKRGYVKRLKQLAGYYEPALHSLVSPSRIDNQYTRSMRTSWPRPPNHGRYSSVNTEPLAHRHTVEVRLHNGTLNGPKILTWISLWMRILATARIPFELSEEIHQARPFNNYSESNVSALADFVDASPKLKHMLLIRRDQIVEDFWKHDIPSGLRHRWMYQLYSSMVDTL